MAGSQNNGRKSGAGARTRKPASKRPRPRKAPVTIDLEAEPGPTSVETPDAAVPPETPTPPEPPAPPAQTSASAPRSPTGEADGNDREPPRTARPGNGAAARFLSPPLLVAAVMGAAAVVVVVFLLQATGLVPVPGRAEVENLAARTVAVEERLASAARDNEALAGRLASLSIEFDRMAAEGSSQGDELRSLANALTDLSAGVAAAGSGITQPDVEAAMARLENRFDARLAAAGGETTDTVALATLAAGLADLEARMAGLSDARGATTTGAALARLMLDRLARHGAPFALALDAVAAFDGEVGAVAKLRPHAEAGVPSRADLGERFVAVAAAMREADAAEGSAQTDEDEAAVGWLGDLLSGIISVRVADAPDGQSSASAGIEDMAAAVGRGDLEGALVARAGLSEAARQVSQAWAANAENRIAVDGLVARIVGGTPEAGD